MEQIIIVLEGEFEKQVKEENATMDSFLDLLGHEFGELAKQYGATCHIEDMLAEDVCTCNAQEPNEKEGICENCMKSIIYKKWGAL